MPRSRTLALLTLAVLVLLATAQLSTAAAQQPPPSPPPLAFRTATLDRAAHTIDVELMAAAAVSATVVISRHGVRLGRATGSMDRGGTVISVRIGRKGIKPLRKGLHVDVAIFWGAAAPLRAHPALRLAPRDEDGPLAA